MCSLATPHSSTIRCRVKMDPRIHGNDSKMSTQPNAIGKEKDNHYRLPFSFTSQYWGKRA
jgi:hypothetical protein